MSKPTPNEKNYSTFRYTVLLSFPSLINRLIFDYLPSGMKNVLLSSRDQLENQLYGINIEMANLNANHYVPPLDPIAITAPISAGISHLLIYKPSENTSITATLNVKSLKNITKDLDLTVRAEYQFDHKVTKFFPKIEPLNKYFI